MKIAFYCPLKPINHRFPSGDRLIPEELYRHLINNGHDVFILSEMRTIFFYREKLRYLFVYIPYNFFKSFIISLLKKPDAFISYHVKDGSPDFIAPLLSIIFNKPYYIYVTSIKCNKNIKLSKVSRFAVNKAISMASHIFLNEYQTYQTILDQAGVKKVDYIKQGLCLGNLEVHSVKSIRYKYNIDETIPIIASCAMCRSGRKTESIRFLIDCLYLLKKKDYKFIWIHAGGGWEYDKIREYAMLKLDDLAIMPGYLNKKGVQEILSVADIFAYPGIDEQLGMAYLEAQFYQNPVVAFDNGGINEVVKNNITGFLVDPMNIDAYVSSIELLLLDRNKRKYMGRKAKEYVIMEHDIYKNYKKLIEILSQS